MKQLFILGNIKRFVYVAMVTFWLGIAIVVGFYVFLSRKTPPVVPKETSAGGIELSFPRDGEIVKEQFMTVIGKTAYGTSRVLVVTGKGEYVVVQPKADGTFSVEVGADEGPNLISAFVFPTNEASRRTQKIFFSFPRDPVDTGDTATLGTIEALGTHSFILTGTTGTRFDVSVLPGVSLADLVKSETVTVVSRKPADGKKLVAAFVFVKPLYSSFIGRVKTIGDSITLLPEAAGALSVRLIPRRDVRLLRYNDQRGVITTGHIEDLRPGDTVVVDVLQVAGTSDVMELRTIIIVPESS